MQQADDRVGALDGVEHLLARQGTIVRREPHVAVLGEQIVVFDSTIRFAQAAAVDCRREGRLAHEYEQAALSAEPWWKATAKGESFSRAATGLADDYQQLTNEILAALAATRTTRRTA
jgi:hypothetical protein